MPINRYQYTITKVPRDESARRELLANKPPAWEYLLFGGMLAQGLQRTEPKWRDYRLGIAPFVGPSIRKEDLANEMVERLSRGSAIVSKLDKLFDPQVQELAFGAPGKPGDPDLIEHIAARTVDMYEGLLDWATELRALRLPEGAEELIDLAVLLVEQPIDATRDFIKAYVQKIEYAMESLLDGSKDQVNLSLGLIFSVPSTVVKDFEKYLAKILK